MYRESFSIPWAELALWINDFPLSSRRVHGSPQLIALISFFHSAERTAEMSWFARSIAVHIIAVTMRTVTVKSIR